MIHLEMETAVLIVDFLGDLTTAVLGFVAIYTLLFHREKIGAFVRILAHALINERIKRLKGSLGALENLDYDVKEERKEIFAMLGEVAGMIKGFTASNEGFKACYDELLRVTEGKESLSESKKRRLIHEIHGLLDDEALQAALTLTDKTNGS